MATQGPNATAALAAVNLLNVAAGNVGKTVRFGPDSAFGKATPYAEVAALVGAMGKGEVELLLLGPGVNPAFTLPGGLKAADAIGKVPMVVSFANQPDETTALAHLVLPDTHWLESWGDYAPRDGVVGLCSRPCRRSATRGKWATSCSPWHGRPSAPKRARSRCPGRAWGSTCARPGSAALPGQWAAALQQGGAWRDVAPAPVTPRSLRSTSGRRNPRATAAASPCGHFPPSACTTGAARSAPGSRRPPTR